VEFRLLQLVVSAVADERVTVGLLHWDGTELRFAASLRRVPDRWSSAGLTALQSTLDALKADTLDFSNRSQRPLTAGIDSVRAVREGHSGVVAWSPIRRARTASSKDHFERLATELALTPASPEARTPRTGESPRSFRHELASLGERLRGELSDDSRLRVQNEVRGLRDYVSPISWKNSVWHHTFPIALHDPDPDIVVRRIETMLGRVDVCVPPAQRGVLVAAHPARSAVVAQLQEIAAFIERSHGDRVRLIRAPLAKTRQANLSDLEARIRSDIAHAGND
jgi:hypothetical protein